MVMVNEYVEYITRQNDTWDIVAWKHYGDALRFQPIVEANPHVPITPLLPSGIVLAVPMLQFSPPVDTTKLPPWRQS